MWQLLYIWFFFPPPPILFNDVCHGERPETCHWSDMNMLTSLVNATPRKMFGWREFSFFFLSFFFFIFFSVMTFSSIKCKKWRGNSLHSLWMRVSANGNGNVKFKCVSLYSSAGRVHLASSTNLVSPYHSPLPVHLSIYLSI